MTRFIATCRIGGTLLAICAAAPSAASGQQVPGQAPPAQPATTRPAQPTATRPAQPATTRPAQLPAAQGVPPAAARRIGGVLRGFSVVLVMGDLQGTSATDDVPAAARKALSDMREFLPYKSYRLLDAGWMMCCGDDGRGGPAERRMSSEISNLTLRGPDDQEYEVKLSTAGTESGRVLVRRFALFATGSSPEAAASQVTARTLQRRLADLEDRAQLRQTQIAEARRRVETGTAAPTTEITKLEVELRSLQREIEELRERIAGGGRSNAAREAPRMVMQPSSIIDTSFTMDVGETVVVGASRPKGAAKALIALVTAVPRPGSAGAAKD
jgi:hypothetical protein